jgi:hypothetical protein
MGRRVRSADFVITVVLLVAAAAVLLEARAWPLRAALFPLVAASALLGLTALKVLVDLLRTRREPAPVTHGATMDEGGAQEAELADAFATASRAEWVSAVGWMAAFFVLLWALGALVAVPLFALVYLLVVSRESPVLAAGYALLLWAFIYGPFDRLLRIPMPPGTLLEAVRL